MDSSILILGSLALVILLVSVNCSTVIGDAVSGQLSDSFHQVLDCDGFGSSLHQEDHHLLLEMEVSGFKSIAGPKVALTFLEYAHSTPLAHSVCDLIRNQRMLVIICTLTSYEKTLFDDSMTQVPTSCGEPVLPKAKLEVVSSVLYMIRQTSEKASCFSALISSFQHWQKEFYQDIKFHRDHVDFVTLNLTSLATRSRKQKIWGMVQMDEASLSTISSSLPLLWTFTDDIGCKNALVGTENAYPGNYRRPGWSFPTARKAVFRIGVLSRSNITDFATGVFEAAVRRLPFRFTYKLIPFNGSPEELVEKVAHKTFDVAIGDTVTTAGHNRHVEFSVPYLEPGFMMVVKANTNVLNEFWWFVKPFTPQMWFMIAFFTLLIGVVIRVIEGQDGDGLDFLDALLFIHRPPSRNNGARILWSLWVFVMVVLTQVYTSMLTNILTNSLRQEPSTLDVDSLRRTNAAIGCDGQSQTMSYLVKVLGFKRRNIRIISSIDDYAEALSSGSVKASILLTPYAKVFLAKHCADFIEIEPTYGYNLGGFGFVFPKGSPLTSDISAAILELEETGKLQLMEEEMLSLSDCSRKVSEDSTFRQIGPSSFVGVFVVTGVISAIALCIKLMELLYRGWLDRIERMLVGREMWTFLIGILRRRRNVH